VLLHLVDIAPPEEDADPVRDVRAIAAELGKFSADLIEKPRWLVINKRDLLPDADAEKKAREIVRRLRHKGPWFLISGVTGAGTRELAETVMRFLEAEAAKAREAAAAAAADAAAAAALPPQVIPRYSGPKPKAKTRKPKPKNGAKSTQAAKTPANA